MLVFSVAAWAPIASADFIEDSKASLQLRNMYFNRDFREDSGQSKRDEWAQGFLLKVESGYTEGTVGFGLDTLGLLGVKLDSSPDRVNTGMLPTGSDGRAADEFSSLGLTAKMRISKTDLKVGTFTPTLPVLKHNDGRIVPQTFEGAMITSTEISKLSLTGGQLSNVKQRNSTDEQDLQLNNKNKRFSGAVAADYLNLVGVEAQLSDRLSLSYFAAELDDVYRQHFAGLKYGRKLGEGTLNADIRLFTSSDYGRSAGGEIDNQAFNGMLSYKQSGHGLGLGWQLMSGDTGFAYVDGTDPYLINFSQINDFAEAKERSWQVRYDYDFASIGIPGLSVMTRYISGTNAKVAGAAGDGNEWERDSEISYVFQNGMLKNLSLRYRNASYRSSFSRDIDESRFIIGYTIALL